VILARFVQQAPFCLMAILMEHPLAAKGKQDCGIKSTSGADVSWASCAHAQSILCQKVHATIPNVEHVEVNAMGCSDAAERAEGAWLQVVVVSDFFEDLRLIDRHRLVHLALGSELASGSVQALQELLTLTGAQWRAREARRRIAGFEARLRASVPEAEYIQIVDLTDGHTVQGFFDGSGRALDPHGLELQVTVVSRAFENKRPLLRQQLVHEAFGPEILSGKIHALPNLKTLTPVQWQRALAKTQSCPTASCQALNAVVSGAGQAAKP